MTGLVMTPLTLADAFNDLLECEVFVLVGGGGQTEFGSREDGGFGLDAPSVVGTYLEGNTF